MITLILVIVSIIFFVTLKDMKAEIGAQKRLLFTQREQITELEKSMSKMREDLERATAGSLVVVADTAACKEEVIDDMVEQSAEIDQMIPE